MSLRAIIPPSTRRRWDQIAAAQLSNRALHLETENSELRSELADAVSLAEHWYENSLELAGDEPGLTIKGLLVRMDAFDGRPLACARGEYQRDAQFYRLVGRLS